MIQIYSTENNNLKAINNLEEGCWINLISPSEDEIQLISKKVNISTNLLKAALDSEEKSRIDKEDNNTLFVVDIPFAEMDENTLIYDTYPLGIIHSKNQIITVCLKNSKIITDFILNKKKSIHVSNKTKFTLQILQRIYNYYLIYLRQIDKKGYLIEEKLYKSMKNRELAQLHSLKKSLVYFSASLKSTQITLERIHNQNMLSNDEDDLKLFEDILIENQQAVEMTEIYTKILSSTIMFCSSIISNNFNSVTKLLTALTTVFSLYTISTGIFGMNVSLPLEHYDYAFIVVIGGTTVVALLALYILNKYNLLK